MRFITAIVFAALTMPGLARADTPAPAQEEPQAKAWEGNESYLTGVIAGSMLVGNCDPVKKLIGEGENLYLQGHHERCLGVVAFKSSLEAEKKGETEKAAAFHQTFCSHYKTAQDFWQQEPLPTTGSEDDVKRRKGYLEEVISTREKRCQASTAPAQETKN